MATLVKDLDSLFIKLIAEKDNVKPEKVTVEYIHEQREKKVYPKMRYEIGTDYSGYNETGLTFLSGEEFDEIEREANKFLDNLE